jgi:hypothetical protein
MDTSLLAAYVVVLVRDGQPFLQPVMGTSAQDALGAIAEIEQGEGRPDSMLVAAFTREDVASMLDMLETTEESILELAEKDE